MKLNILNYQRAYICTSCCCCVIFFYLSVLSSGLAIYHVTSADQQFRICDAIEELYQMKNTCLSNNLELDKEVNASLRTEVSECIIGESTNEKCVKPKTFMFYDLLSMPRMTNRLGYLSQCALEGSWPVEQNEMWIETLIGPYEVYRNDDWGITVTVNGTLLAYVPLCTSNFVEQPIKVNYSLDSLNHVSVQGVVSFPSVVAKIEGTAVLRSIVEGWWDYSWEEAVESSVVFPLKIFGSVSATDILLEHPSINGLTALKSDSVSARLNITELGDISDFSFSMEDSSFCDGSYFAIDLCPYIKDYMYNSFNADLKELVFLYAEIGFSDIEDKLATSLQNSTYTEIDFWGLKGACSFIDCDGLTLMEFVEKLGIVARIHVWLSCISVAMLCCSCVIRYRSKRVVTDTKPNSEIEENSLLHSKEDSGYGSVVDLSFKNLA